MEEWYTDYAKKTYLKIKADATGCRPIKPYLQRQ